VERAEWLSDRARMHLLEEEVSSLQTKLEVQAAFLSVLQ